MHVIHMVDSKLEEITDSISQEVVAANVNVSVDRCTNRDCSERFLAIEQFARRILIYNHRCEALDHVIYW